MSAPDHTEVQKALPQANKVVRLMQDMGSKAKVASAHMARAPAAIKNRAISQGKILLMLELQRRRCDDGRQNAYCKA